MQTRNIVNSARNVRLSPNRVAAIIVWLVGGYTTALAFGEMGATWYVANVGGLLAQAVFTVIELPVWRRARLGFVGSTVVSLDAFFNFGGVWQYVTNIDKTTAWHAVNEASGTNQPLPFITKVVIAVLLSLAIAAAPEWLWEEV